MLPPHHEGAMLMSLYVGCAVCVVVVGVALMQAVYELQGMSGVRLLDYRPYQIAGEDAWTELVV
jgi:hypothetical protein